MAARTLLDRLLEPGALRLLFQPIYRVQQGRSPELFALECLTRGPAGTSVEYPNILFEYVRRMRSEHLVDQSVISNVLAVASRFSPAVKLSINVNASTLGRDAQLVDHLGAELARRGVDPRRLIVEVVESTAVLDASAYKSSLETMRQMGVGLALDDIGVGHSNFRMILESAPDLLKLDRCIVDGCAADRRRQAVIESVTLLARRMGVEIVAEGVEEPPDLHLAMSMGIELVQGYILGSPVSLDVAVNLAPGPDLPLVRGAGRIAPPGWRSVIDTGDPFADVGSRATGSGSTRVGNGRNGGILRILLVDSSPFEAARAIRALEESPEFLCEVNEVETVGQALEQVRFEATDLVLVDPGPMHERESLEMVRLLTLAEPSVPVVVFASDGGKGLGLAAIQAGAQDYLEKGPTTSQALVRTLRYAVERHQLLQELQLERSEASYQATHDHLTGLPNRFLFVDRVETAIRYASRHGEALGLHFVDMDGFKRINDDLGHAAGDEALRLVAKRLLKINRAANTVGRFGGDEFVILQRVVSANSDALCLATRILDSLSAPAAVAGLPVSLSSSLGLALFPRHGETADALLRAADSAMYWAKSAGGDRHAVAGSGGQEAVLVGDPSCRSRSGPSRIVPGPGATPFGTAVSGLDPRAGSQKGPTEDRSVSMSQSTTRS